MNFEGNVYKNSTSLPESLLFLVWCCFSELVQRLFQCDNSQNTNLAPDKELNAFVCGFLLYVIIYRCYKLPKTVHFLAHPGGSCKISEEGTVCYNNIMLYETATGCITCRLLVLIWMVRSLLQSLGRRLPRT